MTAMGRNRSLASRRLSAVAECFGNMDSPHLIRARKVCDCPGHTQHKSQIGNGGNGGRHQRPAFGLRTHRTGKHPPSSADCDLDRVRNDR